MDEPCPWRVGVNELIAGVCANCGHNNLVHPGLHNPTLTECVICSLLYQAVRLEEMRSPKILLTIPVTEEEQRSLAKDMSLMKHRHEPVDHTGGRVKPSATVRRLRCMVCDDWLMPNHDETAWVHESS